MLIQHGSQCDFLFFHLFHKNKKARIYQKPQQQEQITRKRNLSHLKREQKAHTKQFSSFD